ncbi:MAG: DUF5131 family protein [Candidatus Rokubacteria bacterium]|nr:DUF5131 family protein [Candidatus Rokubacteria bacterium]
MSYEPAIGPINFERLWDGTLDALTGHGFEAIGDIGDAGHPRKTQHPPGLNWIVVGGESGTGARPFDLAWARSTISQCRSAGVACFVKQLGAHALASYYDDGLRADYEERGWDWPDPVDWDTTYGQPPLSSRVRLRLRDRKGDDMAEWPADLRVREWPR